MWKLDLIARVEARIHAPPASLPLRGDPRAQEYRRVQAEGTYDHARETFVQALTERGAGFWVLTPLRTPAGIVLVNRGFVPSEKRPPAARAVGQPKGLVTVTGLVRVDEPKGTLLRSNDPAQDRWYSRDVEAIARSRGIGPVMPFFIDAEAAGAPGGYPVGGLTVIRFANNHLIYALTWFGLALLSATGGALLLGKAERR